MQQHMTINTIYTYTEKPTTFFFFFHRRIIVGLGSVSFVLSGLIKAKDKQLFGLHEVNKGKVTFEPPPL